MMFNRVELVTQQLRKFRATFASAVVTSSCAKGRCLTVNLPFYTSTIAVCITVASLVAPVLRHPTMPAVEPVPCRACPSVPPIQRDSR